MALEEEPAESRAAHKQRRRFLRMLGASGVVGGAGCLGGEDVGVEDGSDDAADDEAGDDDKAGDAVFEVSNFEPSGAEIDQGETFDVSALVTNTGGRNDEQVIEYRVDDDVFETASVSLGPDNDELVSFEDIDMMDVGEYTHGFHSDDDETIGTLSVTAAFSHNHTYARRPVDAADPFYVFWADSDASQPSESRLYFVDSTGENYWQLPYHMDDEFAKPIPKATVSDPLSADYDTQGAGNGSNTIDGYQGIWFTLGQLDGEFGDKYSGGFGTYTMKHVPIAAYSPEVNKTFFTYGGTRSEESDNQQQDLLVMASYYDHEHHRVPKPTVVDPKEGVTDPHDNGSISIGQDGHVWIFVSGRSTARPGYKYRSEAPYSVESFELISEEEMTYPQPWYSEGEGFFHFFTKYTDGRELYWETSDPAGTNWSADEKLAGFGGHYQTSLVHNGTHITALNWHPNGSVDSRTNMYVVKTEDHGESWETMDGIPVEVPLESPENDALVYDYDADDRLVYLNDINVDSDGNPIVHYVTSETYAPGPDGDPRHWEIAHWTGDDWHINVITQSDHNYDAASLYVEDDQWIVIGPSETGPQPYHTGGDMAKWVSEDQGETWEMVQQITNDGE